jgi:hypothetical protein
MVISILARSDSKIMNIEVVWTKNSLASAGNRIPAMQPVDQYYDD